MTNTKQTIEKANQFYYGEGETLDLVKAAALYKDAADEGDFEAMCLYLNSRENTPPSSSLRMF